MNRNRTQSNSVSPYSRILSSTDRKTETAVGWNKGKSQRREGKIGKYLHILIVYLLGNQISSEFGYLRPNKWSWKEVVYAFNPSTVKTVTQRSPSSINQKKKKSEKGGSEALIPRSSTKTKQNKKWTNIKLMYLFIQMSKSSTLWGYVTHTSYFKG